MLGINVFDKFNMMNFSLLQSNDLLYIKDTPMLIGEMDSSGSLNAHSLFHLSEKIRAKAVFQVSSSMQYGSSLIKHFLTQCGLTSYSFIDSTGTVCHMAV